MTWTKNSWKNVSIKQQPIYSNQEELYKVLNKLEKLPPLVFAGEVRELQSALARVCRKEAFLLQGGDCAESLANFGAGNIRDMCKILHQMAIGLTFAGGGPVVKMGRMAGEVGKARRSE